jgi:hypothetical protein
LSSRGEGKNSRKGSDDGMDESDIFSQITLTGFGHDQKEKKLRLGNDNDGRSISSFDSMATEYVVLHSIIYARDVTDSKSSNFLDTNEIYEEWTFRWNVPKRGPQKSFGLFGIKVKQYWEDPGFWSTSLELRSQAELKEKYELAKSGISGPTYKASVEKAIRSLPEELRELIDVLIEDREEATSNEHFKRQ